MLHFIKQTEDFGRGLYATQDVKSGKILFSAELIVLSPEDTLKVQETALRDYTFKFNETQDCIVLGEGELFNHSATPNVGYKLIKQDGRTLMYFFTLSEVEAGSQFFIDYAADSAKLVSEYKMNLIA
jgi:uncharacterized cysteine cluster protein YcgN (CxxCxxCC family)